MKEKNTAKRLFSVLWIYLLCAALTAILIPLPQKESSGELWRQYEARLDTVAAQERVMTIEDSDSALLLRLQLIESARRELIFSTFDLRADGSGQDLMAALYGAAQRGVRLAMLSEYYNDPDDAPPHVLVVNYSGIDIEKLPRALARLAEIGEEQDYA